MTRLFFSDSSVEVDPLGDQDAFSCDDAEVWMEGDAILVSYFDDEGIVVLEGISKPGSGYTLMARSRARSATLAPIPEATAAEPPDSVPGAYQGRVTEHGETASWKLRLGCEAREADSEEERSEK